MHALYGAKGRLGLPRRAIVIVDAGGVVRYHHASQVGLTYKDSDTIASIVKKLQPESR